MSKNLNHTNKNLRQISSITKISYKSGIPESTLRAWVKKEKIKSVRFGKLIGVFNFDLLQFLFEKRFAENKPVKQKGRRK